MCVVKVFGIVVCYLIHRSTIDPNHSVWQQGAAALLRETCNPPPPNSFVKSMIVYCITRLYGVV